MPDKSFTEILAEEVDEYTYYVRSTADIHNPERFARVRISLLPYQVKYFQADGYTPWSKGNKKFPNEPNSPVYSIKVVTGLPLDCKSVIQTVAMITNIHVMHLILEPEDGPENIDMVPKPKEINAQDAVGEKRIGAFIRELQGQRSERMKKTTTREVYESYFTTQLGLERVVHQPLRKGYYIIETFKEDGNNYLKAEGPFESRPDGNSYRDIIKVKNLKTITETVVDGQYNIEMLIDIDKDCNVSNRMFEVKVRDSNSGRQFSTLVRASEPRQATQAAIQQVSEEHNLSTKTLTTMMPTLRA